MHSEIDLPNVTQALVSRYREILSARAFRVEMHGRRLTVTALQPSKHAGSALNGPGFLLLKVPFPRAVMLRFFFESEAGGLQKFVSQVLRSEWPAPGAAPHAHVTDTQVFVWYGGESYGDAVVAWRPLDLSELYS
jgi:hypothetical protein